ncbi:processed acidic surface protein [Bacillus sp. B15-48]|uniref:processed acidic surface protein n=1 Tax=Bacillus sp. B15-48 TaxID=1548601 RepID=UPI00193EEB6A
MKLFRGVILSLILAIGVFPSVGFAVSASELTTFLEKEGLTEEQLSHHLSFYWETSLEDFDSIEELEFFLGERITDENLQELLSYYEIDSEEELVQLLVENGEIEAGEDVRNVFLYIDALDFTVDFYTGVAITDENLQQLLDDYGLTLDELVAILAKNDDALENYQFIEDLEVSLLFYEIPITENSLNQFLNRYGLTLDELQAILANNGVSLEDYETIDDLEYALFMYGMPITEQSLQELLDFYELTKEQLQSLLAKYDDSLDHYETIDGLYLTVAMYMLLDESDFLFEELGIGLTNQEFVNLVKHFLTIDFMDPAFEEKMLNIDARLSALGDFESISELTEAELNELFSLYQEMLDLFQLEAKYYLVKGTEKKALTELEAFMLESTNGANLLIEFYNKNGKFLADILLTADLFGGDLIDKIDQQLGTIGKVVDQAPKATPKKEKKKDKKNSEVRTVKGGKLPNTAGNYAEGIVAGFGMILVGAALLRRRQVKRS